MSVQEARSETAEAQAKKLDAKVSRLAPRPALALGAIRELTSDFREHRAERHDIEAQAAVVRGEQAWDAIGRRAGCYAVYPGPLVGPRHAKRVSRDSPTHVKRIRRRWKSWRDKKGRARRSIETSVEYVPAHDAHRTRAAWHDGRATGQRERLETVAACGLGSIVVTCSACGVAHEGKVYCGVVRLCQTCTQRRSARIKARFAQALCVVAHNADAAGSFNRFRTGGALSEHHLVLTIPHVVVDAPWEPAGAWGWTKSHREDIARKATASRRINLLFEAWRYFSRRMQAWQREPWQGLSGEAVGSCWHRAFEWTAGSDGMGHPHFHIWTLFPWMPEYDDHRIASVTERGKQSSTRCKAQGEKRKAKRCKLCELCKKGVERREGARTWWRDALAREGVAVDHATLNMTLRQAYVAPRELIAEVQKPGGISYQRRVIERLEIRAAKTGGLVSYFEGWTIDHVDRRTLEVCGPDVIAGVFEALEGRRLSQSSKVLLRRRDGTTKLVGFLGIADALYDASCGDCNAHSAAVGKPMLFAPRDVDVTTWRRVVAREAFSASPPAQADVDERGPPIAAAPLSLEALVKQLRQREAAEGVTGQRAVTRLYDVCDTIRAEGQGILPVYRRSASRSRPARRWTFRDRMAYAAKLRRKS